MIETMKTTPSFDLARVRAASFEAVMFEEHALAAGRVDRTVPTLWTTQGTAVSAAGLGADCTEVLDPKTSQMFDVVVDDNPGFRTWSPPV